MGAAAGGVTASGEGTATTGGAIATGGVTTGIVGRGFVVEAANLGCKIFAQTKKAPTEANPKKKKKMSKIQSHAGVDFFTAGGGKGVEGGTAFPVI